MMALYTRAEKCSQTLKYRRIVVICGYYPLFYTIISSVFLCWACGTALHANPWRIQYNIVYQEALHSAETDCTCLQAITLYQTRNNSCIADPKKVCSLIRYFGLQRFAFGHKLTTDHNQATPDAWFHTPAAKQMRTAFFWVITQRAVLLPYRLFGRTYHYRLRDKPEERSSQCLALFYTRPPLLRFTDLHRLMRHLPVQYVG